MGCPGAARASYNKTEVSGRNKLHSTFVTELQRENTIKLHPRRGISLSPSIAGTADPI